MPNRPLRALVHLAVIAAGFALPAHAQERTPKVLVIGIDGIRPDVLAEVETPNLDALIAEGFYSAEARTRYPTYSGPGWSSMLNGVWLVKHGVTNNSFHGDQYDRYPDFLTRIETARPELETAIVADWLPIVAAISHRPIVSDAVDHKMILDGYELGWQEADAESVRRILPILREGEADATFVYIGNADETSHQAGGIGEPYRAAIREADRLVGRLMTEIRARPTYDEEDWLILSSTDHGRLEGGGHGGDSEIEKTIYFLASGPSVDRAWTGGTPEIVDVAVTALAHLGIEIDPRWSLDGKVVGIR